MGLILRSGSATASDLVIDHANSAYAAYPVT